MRYAFLASALVSVSRVLSSTTVGEAGQNVPEAGVICRLKAGQLDAHSSPCLPTTDVDAMGLSQGPEDELPTAFADMNDDDPNAVAFLAVSEDAAVCNVFALGVTEAQTIPSADYCNKTQLDDCAKVNLVCRKPDTPALAHPQPQRESIAEPVALPHQRATLAPVVQLVAQDPKAQGGDGPGDFPHRAVFIGNAPPGTKLQPDMIQELLHDRERGPGRASRAPLKPAAHASTGATVAMNRKAAAEPSKSPTGPWPSASGSKHIIGMAGGLGTVLFIFVIWM